MKQRWATTFEQARSTISGPAHCHNAHSNGVTLKLFILTNTPPKLMTLGYFDRGHRVEHFDA